MIGMSIVSPLVYTGWRKSFTIGINQNQLIMIITFDNKIWSKSDLIKEMEDDNFYYNYLGKNTLSSSIVTKLLESPRAYQMSLHPSSKSTSALDFGWLFHTAILEPDVYEDQVFLDVSSRNTKKFKDAKEEFGRVFTKSDRWKVERLSDAFYGNSNAVNLLSHSKQEVPAIGEIEGVPFRGKADILGDGYVADIKTTTGISGFRYSANKWNYDSQCYIYCQLFNIDPENFWFIAIDKETYTVGIYNCSDEFYDRGKQKVLKAIDVYKKYFVDKTEEVGEFFIRETL